MTQGRVLGIIFVLAGSIMYTYVKELENNHAGYVGAGTTNKTEEMTQEAEADSIGLINSGSSILMEEGRKMEN